MDKSVHEEKYRGLAIKIYQDEDPLNPRTEWDNFGHMICFHRDYMLGDKHDITPDTLVELVKRDDVIAIPLFLLDHSGLWMRTGRFECDAQGWDTSKVGFIYVTHNEVRKELKVKRITPKVQAKVLEYLENEVKTFSNYLEGNVWGYVVEDSEGEHVDSCWGFYGDYDHKEYGALKAAKDHVDAVTNKGKTDCLGQFFLPGMEMAASAA